MSFLKVCILICQKWLIFSFMNCSFWNFLRNPFLSEGQKGIILCFLLKHSKNKLTLFHLSNSPCLIHWCIILHTLHPWCVSEFSVFTLSLPLLPCQHPIVLITLLSSCPFGPFTKIIESCQVPWKFYGIFIIMSLNL